MYMAVLADYGGDDFPHAIAGTRDGAIVALLEKSPLFNLKIIDLKH